MVWLVGGKASILSNFNLMMYKVWLEKIRRPVSFLLEMVQSFLWNNCIVVAYRLVRYYSLDLFFIDVGLCACEVVLYYFVFWPEDTTTTTTGRWRLVIWHRHCVRVTKSLQLSQKTVRPMHLLTGGANRIPASLRRSCGRKRCQRWSTWTYPHCASTFALWTTKRHWTTIWTRPISDIIPPSLMCSSPSSSMNILFVVVFVRLTSTISADRKNWTYTLRPNQMDVPSMYSEGLF